MPDLHVSWPQVEHATAYHVALDGDPVIVLARGLADSMTLILRNLAQGAHQVVITALDATGNASDPSLPLLCNVYGPDFPVPAPAEVSLLQTFREPGEVQVTFDHLPDVYNYDLFVDGVLVRERLGPTPGQDWTGVRVPMSVGPHSVTLLARDRAGHVSEPSQPAGVMVVALQDLLAAPFLRIGLFGTSDVRLMWEAVEGAQAPGYDVFRNGVRIATVALGTGDLTYDMLGLAPGTYDFFVLAHAPVGYVSPASNIVRMTI